MKFSKKVLVAIFIFNLNGLSINLDAQLSQAARRVAQQFSTQRQRVALYSRNLMNRIYQRGGMPAIRRLSQLPQWQRLQQFWQPQKQKFPQTPLPLRPKIFIPQTSLEQYPSSLRQQAKRLIQLYAPSKKSKTIDDIINESIPGRKTKGKTLQFEKSGGYKKALQDFMSLNPRDVRNIPSGKVGTLETEETVNIRRKSSGKMPTLELRNGRKNIVKIRYID